MEEHELQERIAREARRLRETWKAEQPLDVLDGIIMELLKRILFCVREDDSNGAQDLCGLDSNYSDILKAISILLGLVDIRVGLLDPEVFYKIKSTRPCAGLDKEVTVG